MSVRTRVSGVLAIAVAAVFHVERWWQDRAGWHHARITRDRSHPNVRPFPVAGGVAWMHGDYPSFALYLTALRFWRPTVYSGRSRR